MSNVIPAEIQKLTADLVVSLRAYRRAKGDYTDAMAAVKNATDFRTGGPAKRDLDDAMANGSWLQGEVTAYASALSALCLSQMGESRDG